MTDLRTAAQQALEALEQSETFVPYEGFGMARREAERKHQAAITALRAALAEPVQEPVAYIHRQGNHFEVSERHLDEDEKARGWTEEPLYTAPPQRPAEPVQKPVAYSVGRTLHWHESKGFNDAQLYLAPSQRKPLTDDQLVDIAVAARRGSLYDLHIAIERAHGIT